MSDDEDDDEVIDYVRAAARVRALPLTAERLRAVAAVMARIAAFAADLEAFALADEVEAAGVFPP